MRSRTARGHPFGEAFVVAEHHHADGVALEVKRHAEDAARELDHLAVTCRGEAVNPHDAVGDADDGAFVAGLRRDVEALDPMLDDVADFGGVQLLHSSFLDS